MDKNLTLYNIETGLLELLALREEIAATDGNCGPVNDEIDAYIRKEVQKVDGIAYMLAEFERRSDVAADEAKRQQVRAKLWQARHDRLKEYVERIMQEVGATRLDGELNTMSLRKCPPSVVVNQPELLPNEYKRITITLNLAQWANLVGCMLSQQAKDAEEISEIRRELDSLSIGEWQPDKARISAELKRGEGVPGCELIADKVSLQVK